MITHFTVYGERCSGTNFLTKVVDDNFDLKYDMLPEPRYGWKHFFGHPRNRDGIATAVNCMVLSIVRNPLDYFMSFYKQPFHQSPSRTKDLETFLTAEFYSIRPRLPETPTDFIPHPMDINHDTGKRFKNIFELRSWKNRFLFKTIPSLTLNAFFVRYEDLKTNGKPIVLEMESRFGIKRKTPEVVIEAARISGTIDDQYNLAFRVNEGIMTENYPISDPKIRGIIRNNLDFEAEELVGYSKESILKRLE